MFCWLCLLLGQTKSVWNTVIAILKIYLRVQKYISAEECVHKCQRLKNSQKKSLTIVGNINEHSNLIFYFKPHNRHYLIIKIICVPIYNNTIFFNDGVRLS